MLRHKTDFSPWRHIYGWCSAYAFILIFTCCRDNYNILLIDMFLGLSDNETSQENVDVSKDECFLNVLLLH